MKKVLGVVTLVLLAAPPYADVMLRRHPRLSSTRLLMRVGRVLLLLAIFLATSGTNVYAIPVDLIVAGQLVISEIMANPAGVETRQEWFEVYNPMPVSVDLTGMMINSNNGSFTVTGSGYSIASGAVFLFARTADPALNGGLPSVDYAWDQALSLANNDGQLSLVRPDGALITSSSWTATANGKSLELVGGTPPSFSQGDFALAAIQYGTQTYDPPAASSPNSGTPGAANSVGLLATPGPSQLLITEIMANPTGDETLREWFEVYNAGPAIDLNGLTVTTNSGSFTVAGGAHLIESGAYFVFARTDDPSLNGGLPRVDYAWGESLTLANTNGQLSVGSGSTLAVRVSWTLQTEYYCTFVHDAVIPSQPLPTGGPLDSALLSRLTYLP